MFVHFFRFLAFFLVFSAKFSIFAVAAASAAGGSPAAKIENFGKVKIFGPKKSAERWPKTILTKNANFFF